MRIRTVYIAIDDEEFETEEECLKHEKSFITMSEFVRLFDEDFSPVEWNPENYDRMWDHIYYIVIEPHHEEEVEEWWNKTFYNMCGVSPFYELDYDWRHWKKLNHGDEPTILVYNFDGSGDGWTIFNEIHSKVHNALKRLDLMDALS